MGEALAGKKLGKRAMFLGALAQSIPDIDFVAAFWNSTSENLLAHRGFTHSLLFGIVATFSFALLAHHYHRKHRLGYRSWILFFGLQVGIHLFLDLFNSYGMGLLEPFSHARLSFNTLYVVDPFFSFFPGLAFLVLLILKSRDKRRSGWWRLGILASSVYLVYSSVNKVQVQSDLKLIIKQQKISNHGLFITPAPLNTWLWYVVIRDSAGYHIGYRSLFDSKRNMDLYYFPRNDSLLNPVKDHEELQHLLRFSQGYYTVEKWHDTIVFNDLRFGQVIGWHDPGEKFVFHYFLQHPDEVNRLVVQRGRFAKWNWESTKTLVQRIRGN